MSSARIAADPDVQKGAIDESVRVRLTAMTSRDPDRNPEAELQDALRQLPIDQAIATAASDAHAVLDIVLNAADAEAANRALVVRYGFSEVQAWAVMDVQFRRLTSVDRRKIEQRHLELSEHVAALERELGRG
jgi:DNA gyrase subunit A